MLGQYPSPSSKVSSSDPSSVQMSLVSSDDPSSLAKIRFASGFDTSLLRKSGSKANKSVELRSAVATKRLGMRKKRKCMAENEYVRVVQLIAYEIPTNSYLQSRACRRLGRSN